MKIGKKEKYENTQINPCVVTKIGKCMKPIKDFEVYFPKQPKQHKTKTNTTTSMYQIKCLNAFKAFHIDTCINTKNKFHVLQDCNKNVLKLDEIQYNQISSDTRVHKDNQTKWSTRSKAKQIANRLISQTEFPTINHTKLTNTPTLPTHTRWDLSPTMRARSIVNTHK